ncbi:MAG TPA: peptidylprolyl isomerase [Stellaceae bacterium]|nr:peptidylprolyl isomerase [Stellaceae bacterium]
MTVRSLLALATALLLAAPALAQAPAPAPAPAQGSAPAPAAGSAPEQADPVLARVNGTEIHRSDLIAFLQQLPAQIQQMPMETLYPQLLDKLVNDVLLAEAGKKDKLAEDPEVKRRVQKVEDDVIGRTYITRYLKSAMTEERIKQRYEQFLKERKPEDSVHAFHILVKTEDEAKAIIAQLKAGADFQTLAKDKSIDPSAKQTGGDLDWFVKEEMVPEFSEAAFKLQKGQYTETPVKTQFGYHVILVVDRGPAPPPPFEKVRDELVHQLQTELIESKLDQLRSAAKIETFQADGSASPPPAPAPAITPAPEAKSPPPADSKKTPPPAKKK